MRLYHDKKFWCVTRTIKHDIIGFLHVKENKILWFFHESFMRLFYDRIWLICDGATNLTESKVSFKKLWQIITLFWISCLFQKFCYFNKISWHFHVWIVKNKSSPLSQAMETLCCCVQWYTWCIKINISKLNLCCRYDHSVSNYPLVFYHWTHLPLRFGWNLVCTITMWPNEKKMQNFSKMRPSVQEIWAFKNDSRSQNCLDTNVHNLKKIHPIFMGKVSI